MGAPTYPFASVGIMLQALLASNAFRLTSRKQCLKHDGVVAENGFTSQQCSMQFVTTSTSYEMDFRW